MNLKKTILFPASQLFGALTSVRNLLYDEKVLKSEKFDVPVLVVGNLTVGGTGKTPHVEYLINLLRGSANLAVLSRGYGRKTKGFLLAGPADTPDTIGDEPMLYHSQFKDVTVAVGEDRPAAIKKLLATDKKPDVIILDDAYQHRPLQASFYFLLTDFGRIFYNDSLLPGGLLREAKTGAARANAVVVSKCPYNLPLQERKLIKEKIWEFAPQQPPVFFTTYNYGTPVAIGSSQALSKKVILLTGIANPQPLRDYLLAENYQIVAEVAFPDHYAYRAEDMAALQIKLAHFAADQVCVVTTSKDAIKLQAPELRALTANLPIFYMPIEVSFLEDREKFDAMIRKEAGLPTLFPNQ